MHIEFGPFLILAVVLVLQYAAWSKLFHPVIRILFSWIATWNTHIRLQPGLITPKNYQVPNLDYPSRNLWKFLGMCCAFTMVYIAGTVYAPTLLSMGLFQSIFQGLICCIAMVGGAGYMLHFHYLN